MKPKSHTIKLTYKVCLTCQKQFQPHEGYRPKSRYCSYECRQNYREQQRLLWQAHHDTAKSRYPAKMPVLKPSAVNNDLPLKLTPESDLNGLTGGVLKRLSLPGVVTLPPEGTHEAEQSHPLSAALSDVELIDLSQTDTQPGEPVAFAVPQGTQVHGDNQGLSGVAEQDGVSCETLPASGYRSISDGKGPASVPYPEMSHISPYSVNTATSPLVPSIHTSPDSITTYSPSQAASDGTISLDSNWHSPEASDKAMGRERVSRGAFHLSHPKENMPTLPTNTAVPDKPGAVGSNRPTRRKWLPLFKIFIKSLKIDSKDTGLTTLGDALYSGQERFLEELCAGLDEGVRWFVILKARQLGITTISVAMTLFWISMHDGLQACLVTDTEGNREKLRILIKRYMESLPKGLRVQVLKENRNNMVLSNGSVLDYLVAGTKKKGGALGKSRAFNYGHGTEVSNWGDEEGFASLKASLSKNHPDRLYIFESTAEGFNLFQKEWMMAKKDKLSRKAIFIGWWGNDGYSLRDKPELLEKYGSEAMGDDELQRWNRVKDLYGIEIPMDKIAWYRYIQDTETPDADLMAQNYPWHEEEAFILTGKSFFDQRRITKCIKEIHDTEEEEKKSEQGRQPLLLKAYRYHLGNEFQATDIEQVRNVFDADLRIWEEPVDGAHYVLGVDPAYGRNDWKDSSCIEVFRCYADRLVQVAEFNTPDPTTFQLTWVLAHICGLYRNAMINLEVSGPGFAVIQEFDHLKQLLGMGKLMKSDAEAQKNAKGIQDFFGAARWYLYHKPDQPGKGFVYGWKTNADNKLMIMNQLRDQFSMEQLVVASVPLLEEMQEIVQDGAHIGPESERTHDDRVFASALAVEAWIKWTRRGLVAQGQTFEIVSKQEALMREPKQQFTMGGLVLQDFLKRRDQTRRRKEIAKRWAN